MSNIRKLQAMKADQVKAARAITDKVAAENRDLNEEEQKQFDEHAAQIKNLNAAIEREQMLATEEAGLTQAGGVTLPAKATIEVTENAAKDGKRGFKSFGEFSRSVARANSGIELDRRLQMGAAPGLTANESSGADGGFAIPPEFSEEIWRLSLGEDSLLPRTQNIEVAGNSMIFPKDESTPWGGTGVQAYWQAEASQATATKPVLGTNTMVLHKLMALVPVTNELMDDGFAVGSYLTPLITDRIMWKTNEAILFGDGQGKPLGAFNSKASIVQAKETSQATNTILPANLTNMVSRLLVGELRNAFWLATPDILTYLEGMTVGNYPVYLPNNTMEGAPYGMLKGRPLMLSEHANAFSSQGDINLVSLNGYRTITKAGGIQTSTSMHLYFDADATAFKVTFRLNGAPILSKPVTPPKSPNTRSHFVSLAAR